MYKLPENLPCASVYDASKSVKVLAWSLGLAALLLCCGFLFANSASQDYNFLLYLFNSKVWASIFFTYGTLKIYQAIKGIPYKLDLVTSIVGMWAWIYVFISVVVFDHRPFTPIEILLLLPVILEAWELVLDIFKTNQKLKKESI